MRWGSARKVSLNSPGSSNLDSSLKPRGTAREPEWTPGKLNGFMIKRFKIQVVRTGRGEEVRVCTVIKAAAARGRPEMEFQQILAGDASLDNLVRFSRAPSCGAGGVWRSWPAAPQAHILPLQEQTKGFQVVSHSS